jgi:hypothetical protein
VHEDWGAVAVKVMRKSSMEVWANEGTAIYTHNSNSVCKLLDDTEHRNAHIVITHSPLSLFSLSSFKQGTKTSQGAADGVEKDAIKGLSSSATSSTLTTTADGGVAAAAAAAAPGTANANVTNETSTKSILPMELPPQDPTLYAELVNREKQIYQMISKRQTHRNVVR